MKSVFVTGYALCHLTTSCDFPRRCVPFLCLSVAVDEAAHPRPHTNTMRGPVSPAPALPDKRAQRHSMQDTQPETSVPSNAI